LIALYIKSVQFKWTNNNNNNNNNNNIYLLQMGCHPVVVITLHVFPTRIINLLREGYLRSM
jgi:hypothetical protein